jgi:hypothetical protein
VRFGFLEHGSIFYPTGGRSAMTIDYTPFFRFVSLVRSYRLEQPHPTGFEYRLRVQWGPAMGLLREMTRGTMSVLEADHLVGRTPRASLQLEDSRVSAQHASIRWIGDHWEVKDLGSRNGTVVDGQRVKAGDALPLARGSRVSFGRADQTWELIDDGAPQVAIVPLDGQQEPLVLAGDLMALPSPDDPEATVFRGADGRWVLEAENGIVSLVDRQVFQVAGLRFRFLSPDLVSTTSAVDWPERAASEIKRLHLAFRVSQDEEHVQLLAQRGRERLDLGSRSHNYLLLLLARRRMQDSQEELREAAAGWIYQDELTDGLRITPEHFNVDIYRIRGQFAAIGVADAASIVERRPRTKQVRIGVASLSVEIV